MQGVSPSSNGSPGEGAKGSPGAGSPSFRHARSRQRHSPLEIKERMRQCYKDRIHNSRNSFYGSLRGAINEAGLRHTLSTMLNEMFGNDYEVLPEDEEYHVLEKIKDEIVEDEINWIVDEYEKANMDNIDWASVEQATDVICPTCQKVNLLQQSSTIVCPTCQWRVRTSKPLSQLKIDITNSVENHGLNCNGLLQFTPVPDSSDLQTIYSICSTCGDMTLIL